MFYRVGNWDDLQIDSYVGLHDGFKIQFAGIVPVFLEFNVPDMKIEFNDCNLRPGTRKYRSSL